MRISYSKSEDDAASVKAEGTSHLTAIAIAISIVFVVVALGLWFGFSQSKKAIEAVPAAIVPPTVSPEVQQARVYEAIDGLTQCHKNSADVSTADGRAKRQKCYYAVMTIFTTSAICDLVSLDAPSRELCRKAEEQFIQDYPKGIPQDVAPTTGVPTNSAPAVNTNSSTGAGTQGSPSSSLNTNTSSGGSTGTSSNTNGNTNAPTSGTNTAANTNTTVATGGSAPSGGSTTAGNQNTNSAPNPPAAPPQEICIIDTGEVVLLEHTNNCQ